MKTWLCALFLFLASPALATDYWIAPSPTGSDSNACNLVGSVKADPPVSPGVYKATVASANGCLASGDRIIVKAGTYAQATNNQWLNPVTGSAGNYTTLMADPAGARPVLTINGASTHFGVHITNTVSYQPSYIRVQGLAFDHPYNCYKLDDVTNVYFTSHFEWIDNICHDTYDSGALAGYSSTSGQGTSYLVVRNSEFYYIGKNYASNPYAPGFNTIYGLGNNALIEGNYFHNSHNGVGIWGQLGGGAACPGCDSIQNNNVVRNNRFRFMGRTDLDPWLAGSGGYSCIHQSITGTGNQIYNNLCYDSGSNSNFLGIRVGYHAGTSTNTLVANNTIYGITSGWGLTFDTFDFRSTNLPLVLAKNNIVYLATTHNTSAAVITGAITTNPVFLNEAGRDFHLQSNSPAIGSGENLYATFTTDFTAVTGSRSATGPWTSGAYGPTGGGSGSTGGVNQTVLVWSDTFNRAAEDPLTASNWVRNSAVGHQFVIPSNLASIAQPKLFTAGDAAMVWVTNALNADQYCKFTIGTPSSTTDNTVGYGCTVRTANGTKSDYALVTSTLGYDIRRDLAGSYTSLLKGSTTTLTSGESGMLAVHGSGTSVVLEAFKNGSSTPFATVTDNSVNALQSGYAGIFYSSSETGQTPGSSTHGIDYAEGGNYFYGVDITAPTAPTGLTVTANLPAQLLISWTASTDAVGVTGYEVQRCTPSVCTPSGTINSPTTTTYTDTGLADSTGYSYRVRGRDAAANLSAFSSVVSQTTQTVASPTLSNQFPSGAAVSDVTPITISVTTSIPSTCKYNTRTQGTAAYASLQQDMTVSGLVASASVTPDQHGSNGGVNHFYVACDNAVTPAHTSATLDLTFTMITPVDTTKPTTISDFAMTALDSVRLNATWSAATDAVGVTGYLLSGCGGADCTVYNITLNAGPGTTSAILALMANTVYNFIIQAYDAAGNLGLASNVATMSTFPSAPPEDMAGLSVAQILQQAVMLQWTAPLVEATTALIEQCTPKTSETTCSGTWAQVAAVPLGTQPLMTGLSSGTSYCWRGKFGNSQNAVSANASNIICTTTTSAGQTQPRQQALMPRIER